MKVPDEAGTQGKAVSVPCLGPAAPLPWGKGSLELGNSFHFLFKLAQDGFCFTRECTQVF